MTQQTVAVIDYGMGNLHSVASALSKVSPETRVIVTSDAAEVAKADRVVFPGVGAMRDCMKGIKDAGFDVLLKEQIATGKPVLGICVGMQALLDHSEENGGVDCLSIMPGAVKFFGAKHQDQQGRALKVPHMGWNTVTHNDHPLWANIPQDSRFYFVHSFYIQSTDASLVAATCEYGVEFHAALTRGNLFAVQFHPEKSHTVGLQLLKNFLAWDGQAA
ncbi:MAG: imidazole glycerol phosphate synthase subunit HisH [Cellvibrio sp.]